jgi:wyosine [tRNA(Phe)-imidazoG37] synthetase (radical SAM superfamily)
MLGTVTPPAQARSARRWNRRFAPANFGAGLPKRRFDADRGLHTLRDQYARAAHGTANPPHEGIQTMNAILPDMSPAAGGASTAFGCPRDFADRRLVYTVVSPRARGLSVGVNLLPTHACNFDCVYCEVTRPPDRAPAQAVDVARLGAELERTLDEVHAGRITRRACYRALPDKLLGLAHVAISGDGEPTLCPNFAEALEAVVHVRALGRFPFFKLVLITNGTGLDRPEVVEALALFTRHDEIWAKLDAGTEEVLGRVNKADLSLDEILRRILGVARRRPVVIQSLFAAVGGRAPTDAEIDGYLARLCELTAAGALIPLVQIYSATRPAARGGCEHLPLRSLALIARRIRTETGLRAEVF